MPKLRLNAYNKGVMPDSFPAHRYPSENCRRCRRLVNQFKRLSVKHPDYWNKPVPAHGPSEASLLIVGLAPGLHGANKTGIPFVGDASGNLLHDVLASLKLTGRVKITNAVKCLPVKNLPSAQEVNNCSRYLKDELEAHRLIPDATLLVLGGVAHKAVVKALGARQADFPFGHGAVHHVEGLQIVDSYHCSRYNTQTGRLTRQMFLDTVQLAGNMAYS